MFHASVVQRPTTNDGPECPPIIADCIKANTLAVTHHDSAFPNHSVQPQPLHGHLEHPGLAVWRHDQRLRGIKIPFLPTPGILLIVKKTAKENRIKIDPAILPGPINAKSKQRMFSDEKQKIFCFSSLNMRCLLFALIGPGRMAGSIFIRFSLAVFFTMRRMPGVGRKGIFMPRRRWSWRQTASPGCSRCPWRG